jgi:DNA-directed RNA polymerase subunit RPC12/RpoP
MVCATCGATAEDRDAARLSWAMGHEGGRTVWTCADCSRRNLRSIEGKLDSAWW